MAEIRVGTPQSSTFTDNLRPRQESQSSATIPMGSFAAAEEPVLTVRFNDERDVHNSLHSEPDVDTIMPLPGRGQLQHSLLLTRGKGDSDISDEDDELLHTPTSIGFTKIDVWGRPCLSLLSLTHTHTHSLSLFSLQLNMCIL